LIKKAKKSNSKISQISTGVLVLENKKFLKELELATKEKQQVRFVLILH
jgi:bifunctional N-acetylglucosamine-1-phosphate-uridyltransferase/glucosamine-1-phosphate-acetyltransferase GlmU-like protein